MSKHPIDQDLFNFARERLGKKKQQPRLPRSFYRHDASTVARRLLGQRLVSHIGDKRTSGIIVETEAYLGIPDKAAHSYNGRRTAANEVMWGDGGHAYVYFIYGIYYCVNVVASRPEKPVAVLIRALEPDAGQDLMFKRRKKAKRETDLCSGPGKLCQALGIERRHNGEDLVRGRRLYIERLRSRAFPWRSIVTGPRIGIAYAEEWQHEPLRFCVRNNPHVKRVS